MEIKDAMALDRYLTTPPNETPNNVDNTADYDVDDFGNHVSDNDWVFIGYFEQLDNQHNAIVKRKFVGTQDGFLTALDEYGADNLIKDSLEIVSGKEWLQQ